MVIHNVFSNSSMAAGTVHVLSTSDVLYLDGYLTELSTLTLTPPLDHKVMYSVLETILKKVNESFPDLCSSSLKDLFQVKLKMLLHVTDANILSLFPTKIGCADFQDIYEGLNSVHSKLDPDMQKAVYQARLNFLNGQVAKEGVACTFTADNSRDWLQENFGLSSVYADYSDLIQLDPGFNEKHLIVLPNPWIRDLAFETIFKSFQFSTFTADQYTFWFGSQLQLFLPAINAQYLQLLPLDIDCQSHQNLVQALDKVYNHYTDEQRKAIHGRIFRFLESYRNAQGGTCPPDADSSLWIISNYGHFSAYANMEEFSSLNPNFDELSAVSELSPEQLAQLTMATGALADETIVIKIMNNLNTSSDLAKFFDALNAIASAELQSSIHAHLILSTAFQKIAVGFPNFKARNFAY
ncbi:unnamed protein product [Lepidochelys kempii]